MRRFPTHPRATLATVAVLAAGAAAVLPGAHADSPAPGQPQTPIKHVVVIFGENESFDHYFGTYPNAAHPDGLAAGAGTTRPESPFHPKADTPTVNGLSPTLLTANPNAANPARLGPDQAVTCSQNHGYTAEQQAYDQGLMDKFKEFTAGGGCPDKSIVMDYYDGNTVTGIWNLAQTYAMSDNSYSDGFGPSTVGALNLISGQTHGATTLTAGGVDATSGSVIGDPDPADDDCGAGGTAMSGKNIGDLLNAKGVSWGWFQGGFRPTAVTNGKAVCGSAHKNVDGATQGDYSAHHEPFEYYPSTDNPHHTPPASAAEIGRNGPANHQYDLQDFDTALSGGDLPAVSYLKASKFEDAHPGNSDPLDEQHFVDRTVNAIERSPDWASTMIVLAYDDSDGWYDHQMGALTSSSRGASDQLDDAGVCGGKQADGAYNGRCGVGPRMPLLVVSPYARQDYVDHAQTEQTSILRFIEDNWGLGRIGDQSLDASAGSLNGMLDFDPDHQRAPRITLDEQSGVITASTPGPGGPTPRPPTTVTTPATTVTTPARTVPGPTTTVEAPPTAAPAVRVPKLSCTAERGSGRRLRVTCKARGAVPKGQVGVRLRLVRGSRQLATASATLSHGRASFVLVPRQRLAKGSYVLRETVSQISGVAATKATVRLG